MTHHPAHRAQRPRRTAATWPPTRAHRVRTANVLAAVGALLCVVALVLVVTT